MGLDMVHIMMSHTRKLILIVVALTAIAGVFTGDKVYAQDVEMLDVGDQIYVRIPMEPMLSGYYKVEESGRVFFPVIEGLDIGSFYVNQKTTAEFEHLIRKKLQEKRYNLSGEYYAKNPIRVELVSSVLSADNEVSIFGEVKAPGIYKCTKDMRMLDLLMHALAINDDADLENVKHITRVNGTPQTRTINITNLIVEGIVIEGMGGDVNNIRINPGDYVIVPAKRPDTQKVVTLFGEVMNPTITTYYQSMTLLDLLVEGRNVSDDADLSKVRIVSREGDSNVYDITGLINGQDLSKNVVLSAGDYVIVPPQTTSQKIKVIALGQVSEPGTYTVGKGCTVMELLGEAGGPIGRAGVGKSYIVRLVDNVPTAVPVDMKALINRLDLAQNRVLQHGDIFYIPESGGVKLNQILQNMSLISLLDSTFSSIEDDISD